MTQDLFERVYKAYFGQVYHYLLSRCGDHHLAEELTADTFFRALRNLDRFRSESDPGTWLRAAKLDHSGTVYTARSKDVRYIYYCDHSRGGKLTLLKGPFTGTNSSGGVLLLPRLTLNYYFLASLALTGLFGVLWLAFRSKAAGATLLSVTLGFFSYFLAHLLVKGTDGTSYFLLQDLAFILLTAAALLGIFVSAVSLYRLQK